MTTADEHVYPHNTYVIDPEQGAEMVRLLDQDRLVTANMGGHFPVTFDPASAQHVLDIACGPGGWVQEVAFAYPNLHVVGIDISERMISYARVQAQVQHLDNAFFSVMDATRPLAFPDASFDFVNGRFLVGFMTQKSWPALLAECFRITRPGGIVCLTECDQIATTNSPAFERLQWLMAQAMTRTGHSFHPEGHHMGVTPLLRRFLVDAGFSNLQMRVHILDFSAGAEHHSVWYHNLVTAFKLLQPFAVQLGVTTNEEWDRLYEQLRYEMFKGTFCGLWYYLSVWGQKPQQ
jgi:ubiquinone/menaquinone biosynthesis C-methylase UbiE